MDRHEHPPPDGLTLEELELEAQSTEALPERAAMSTLNVTALDATSGAVEAVGDGMSDASVPADGVDAPAPADSVDAPASADSVSGAPAATEDATATAAAEPAVGGDQAPADHAAVGEHGPPADPTATAAQHSAAVTQHSAAGQAHGVTATEPAAGPPEATSGADTASSGEAAAATTPDNAATQSSDSVVQTPIADSDPAPLTPPADAVPATAQFTAGTPIDAAGSSGGMTDSTAAPIGDVATSAAT